MENVYKQSASEMARIIFSVRLGPSKPKLAMQNNSLKIATTSREFRKQSGAVPTVEKRVRVPPC
jgi:hypothetical protein